MRKKEIFLLFLFVGGVIVTLLCLRFYSFNEFHLRDKLAKYSFFALAASSNVDLNVNVLGVPTPTPSGIAPTPSGITPTPSGSYSYSPSPSGSPEPSGSLSPSSTTSPTGSGKPFPTTVPGGEIIDEFLSGLMLFSGKVGPYNLITALILLLGPILASIFTAFLDPFASIPIYLYYLWLLLLQALGIKKKGKQWGVVYDYISKTPVSLAVVRIIDRSTHQIKDTSTTTRTGGFAFLADEGDYILKVFKTGYRFPVPQLAVGDSSPWIVGKSDGNYQNIYTGGFISVKREDGGEIKCNIPLEYTGESTYARIFAEDNTFFAGLKRVFSVIRMPLLILGSFIAIIALIAQFSILNLVVIAVYLLIWGIFIYRAYFKTRAYGRVVDDLFDQPVGLAMIRLIKVEPSGQVGVADVKASDRRGRFMMLASEGKYYITAMRPGYNLYRSQVFDIKDERLIDFDLRLKKVS